MAEADRFFQQFGDLERLVYANGSLDEHMKELMGLAISIATRCDECVMYHMTRCVELAIDRAKILESIHIAVLAGGSLTFPQARVAFRVLDDSVPSITATESE
ncbi:carboxymuconolactone decarboxylase family protein [Sulfobacillus thermosulfidooxidans]|uniref:carboxymuconolactone decarboxylase family protein n=1 Tax=Sulfobacillus thermosulfidooxidans TaxID=28034 RepID=UPI0006B608E7|nr:carboxymuconolactone decarboxylase family protein [Sulfobacillus thermosulfidooxidans]